MRALRARLAPGSLPLLAAALPLALFYAWTASSGLPFGFGEERDGLYLAIIEKDEGKLVGHALCDWGWDPHSPFIALVIEPARQRQGYGSEILALLPRYLFGQTPAYNISSWAAGWNTPALNFARRHGFRECGRSRREGLYKGKYYDEILVDILRPEWLKAKPG